MALKISKEEQAKRDATEQFRHECEVRYVAKQSVKWIRKHLAKAGLKRGEAARIKLRLDVLEIWEK